MSEASLAGLAGEWAGVRFREIIMIHVSAGQDAGNFFLGGYL